MNVRLTWEKGQIILYEPSVQYLRGITVGPYAVSPTEKGDSLLKVEYLSHSQWIRINNRNIFYSFHHDNLKKKGELIIKYLDFESNFTNVNSDFMDGLQYYHDQIDEHIYWKKND